jgi:hypothetical protein
MFLIHGPLNRRVRRACQTLLQVVEAVCHVGGAGFPEIEGFEFGGGGGGGGTRVIGSTENV